MTATQQFIEDAIKGGWSFRPPQKYLLDWRETGDLIFRLKGSANRFECPVQKVLLDSLAWQAVGKTRGWLDHTLQAEFGNRCWKCRWKTFIDHLADGKTVEEALVAISETK